MPLAAFIVGRDALRAHHHHLSAHVTIAACLALASALAFAVATVAQQRAAAQVSDAHARSGRLVIQLARDPRWWAGTLGTGVGYALQAVALAFGSLLVVQPMLVTSLLFALPLGARLAHQRLPRAVWVWGVVLAASLAVFVSLGNANRGASHLSREGWLVLAAAGIPLVAACLIGAARLRGARRASLLAVAVGLLGGVLALLTKAVVGLVQHQGLAGLWSVEALALLVVGGAGIYVQQLSFQAAALQASLPIILVLEPVVAAVLGLTLLHEQLRVSGLRLAVLLIAVLAMTFATVALARGEARVAGEGVKVPVGSNP